MENEPAAGAEGEAVRITQEGFVIGTPDFLAPEQARNPMEVDIRADIYSLGGTLYYILTGKVPFEGGNPTEKLLKHCTEPPPALLPRRPDAPPQVEQIIHWCMAKTAGSPAADAAATGDGASTILPGRTAGASRSNIWPLPRRCRCGACAAHPIPPAPVAVRRDIRMGRHRNTRRRSYRRPRTAAAWCSSCRRRPPRLTRFAGAAQAFFPWGMVLLALGAVVVLGILGYAAYAAFLRPAEAPLETFTNSLGMRMVKLDGGKFRMGSPENEPGRRVGGRPAARGDDQRPVLHGRDAR